MNSIFQMLRHSDIQYLCEQPDCMYAAHCMQFTCQYIPFRNPETKTIDSYKISDEFKLISR